jgi:hypothetical protein
VEPRLRWEGNTKIDHREIVYCWVNLMHVTQNKKEGWALVNPVMNLQLT